MKFLVASIYLVAGSLSLIAQAPAETTLTGSYIWNQRPSETSDLKAVFKASGEKEWQVAFYFEFRGNKLIYSGSAHGDLHDGPLKGSVKNPGENRTFTFAGKMLDGVFHGTHAEMRSDTEQSTGTLTLSH